jgi:hypothetical protein
MLQRAGGEGVAPSDLDHVGRGVGVEDAGLGPGQRVLQRVIDHVRQVARGEGGGGARAEIAFGDRDHLDRDAGLGLERGGHLFLLGQPLGLLFGRPETGSR